MSTSPVAGIFQAMAKAVSQSPNQAITASAAEAMETHTQTLKEANAGDRQAVRKLAADAARAQQAQAPAPATPAASNNQTDVATADGSTGKLNIVA